MRGETGQYWRSILSIEEDTRRSGGKGVMYNKKARRWGGAGVQSTLKVGQMEDIE